MSESDLYLWFMPQILLARPIWIAWHLRVGKKYKKEDGKDGAYAVFSVSKKPKPSDLPDLSSLQLVHGPIGVADAPPERAQQMIGSINHMLYQ